MWARSALSATEGSHRQPHCTLHVNSDLAPWVCKSAASHAYSTSKAKRAWRGAQWAQLEAATDEYIVHIDAELAAAAALLCSGRTPAPFDPAALCLGAGPAGVDF